MYRALRGTLLCAILLLIAATRAGANVSSAVLEERWRDFYKDAGQARPALSFPYANCFNEAATAHGLPETLLLAVARGESDFDARARSKANAYGLMQILWPATARHLGIDRLSELLDPCTNVEAGARYLKELLRRYRGNVHRALAAYNYGPSRIPVAGGVLPDGALWYSAYILRHLGYVLQGGSQGAGGHQDYGGQGRLLVIRFSRPYRAAAFVESLQPRLGDIRLDWFRRSDGDFDVVMLYADEGDLRRGRRLLGGMGLLDKAR
jgi:hypothetical protein